MMIEEGRTKVKILDELSSYYDEVGTVIVYNKDKRCIMVELEEEDKKNRVWFHLEYLQTIQ